MSGAARISHVSGSVGVMVCPACGGPVKADSKWCPKCHFTGSQTLELFPESPPPLLPILDAAGILNEADARKIDAAREKLRRRFPQFQWRVCTVDLAPESNLSVFGFWLLNVCPLHDKETAEDRASTILLLMNAGTGQVTVVPGYAVEGILSDDDWKSAITTMTTPWCDGLTAEAVVQFFKDTRIQLERAWKKYGVRKSAR